MKFGDRQKILSGSPEKLSFQLFAIFLKENPISGPECASALPAIVDTVFATAQYLAKVKYERVHWLFLCFGKYFDRPIRMKLNDFSTQLQIESRWCRMGYTKAFWTDWDNFYLVTMCTRLQKQRQGSKNAVSLVCGEKGGFWHYMRHGFIRNLPNLDSLHTPANQDFKYLARI